MGQPDPPSAQKCVAPRSFQAHHPLSVWDEPSFSCVWIQEGTSTYVRLTKTQHRKVALLINHKLYGTWLKEGLELCKTEHSLRRRWDIIFECGRRSKGHLKGGEPVVNRADVSWKERVRYIHHRDDCWTICVPIRIEPHVGRLLAAGLPCPQRRKWFVFEVRVDLGPTVANLRFVDRCRNCLGKSSITAQRTTGTSLYGTRSSWVIFLKVWMYVRSKIHVAFVFDLGKSVTIALQTRWDMRPVTTIWVSVYIRQGSVGLRNFSDSPVE